MNVIAFALTVLCLPPPQNSDSIATVALRDGSLNLAEFWK